MNIVLHIFNSKVYLFSTQIIHVEIICQQMKRILIPIC